MPARITVILDVAVFIGGRVSAPVQVFDTILDADNQFAYLLCHVGQGAAWLEVNHKNMLVARDILVDRKGDTTSNFLTVFLLGVFAGTAVPVMDRKAVVAFLGAVKKSQATIYNPATNPLIKNGNNAELHWSTEPSYDPNFSWYSDDSNTDLGNQSPANVTTMLSGPIG